MKHKKWISIYDQLPKDGAKIVSRISGEEGYCGSGTYDANTHTIRTIDDCRNRRIITIWKHDEWYYAE